MSHVCNIIVLKNEMVEKEKKVGNFQYLMGVKRHKIVKNYFHKSHDCGGWKVALTFLILLS